MNKKEAILEAALKLLTQKGVHATPMSAIAKEAGTGMGTIYNYFPNKEILINALYISIKQNEKAVFSAFNKQKPLKTQFEQYYSQAIQFYLDNSLFFNFIEQLQASPIITSESKELGYEAITAVLELIETGKKERVIKRIETKVMMQFIGGTIISYLRLHFQEDNKKKASLKNQLKMVWDAIKE
ncbi:MAG: TetR/AcrR family transcriptional regulator [Saprospiraceae bacterium]